MKKKILSGTLFLLAIFGLFLGTTSVNALTTFGKVTVLSEGTSSIDNNSTANVTVKYTSGNLKWYPKDPDVNRNFDGYWIGIRIDAPEGRAEGAKYQRGGVSVKFDDVKDGQDYVNAWVGVTEERLAQIKAAGTPYTLIVYDFDWDADGNYDDQKITIQIDPDQISLEKIPETHAKVTVNSIVGNRVFTVEKGKSLNEYLSKEEKEALNELQVAPKGKKFIGLFKGETQFSLDEKINTDITLTARFEDIAKDESPKLGVTDSMLFVSIITLLSMTGIITIKKMI